MNIKKRLTSVILLIGIFLLVVFVGAITLLSKGDKGLFKTYKKDTIHLWYTDDSLTDFLNSKALAFYEENDVRVEPVLVSGFEYLEAINKASISEDESCPDIYIVSNDQLERAYLAGLAAKLSKSMLESGVSDYCQTALDSVKYDGNYVGIPFYYETAALLYNKTYLDAIVKDVNEVSSDSEEAKTINIDELVPKTIVDIADIAGAYSAPENVEYFFRWDVSDIFYNYFFLGNAISVGGQSGDDKNNINIYNDEAIACLNVYQQMNQFFSIESKESSYDKVINEFLEGKTIYTLATSDCLEKIAEAKKNESFDFEVGVTYLPDINGEFKTRGMSMTNALVVNGYSEHKEMAEKLASYVAYQAGDDLYTYAGKLPARIGSDYDNDNMMAFALNYDESVPMPKMVETSNFWIELECCMTKVWNGNDANSELKLIAEKILTQLKGEPVSLNRIIASKVDLWTGDSEVTPD